MSLSLGHSSVDKSTPIDSSQSKVSCQPRGHFRLAEEWRPGRIGKVVEIRSSDILVRRGIVEAEMPDGSGMWIAADGVATRSYFDKDTGVELWVEDEIGPTGPPPRH